MLKSIFDLPTHALIIHFPVVLAPLVALAAVALAVRPQWRRRFGVPLLVATAVVTVSVFLAAASGESFAEARLLDGSPALEDHESLGNMSRFFMLGLFLSVLGLVGLTRFGNRSDSDLDIDVDTDLDGAGSPLAGNLKAVSGALVAATLVFSLLSTVWVIRAGHEGAKLHYKSSDVWDLDS